MKKFYFFTLAGLLFSTLSFATTKYWIGPLNGKWSENLNWSLTDGGPANTVAPGIADSAVFLRDALVNVEVPTISVGSMSVSGSIFPATNVRMYATIPVNFTILRYLTIGAFARLKDSTGAAVSFNTILSGSTAARAMVTGTWEFEGGVPLGGAAGAFFTAEPGAIATIGLDVSSIFTTTLLCRNNSGAIASTVSSLVFNRYGNYVMQDNLSPVIPVAKWSVTLPSNVSAGTDLQPTLISLLGMAGNVRHLQATPKYGAIFVNLPNQTTDLSLALPNGTSVEGNVTIMNTNSRTLALLANTAPSTTASIGYLGTANADGGGLFVSGTTANVSLSTVTAADPAIDYKLAVTFYVQTGGNFSLQDNDNAGGSATLSVKSTMSQSAGTFISHSTVPGKRLVLEMFGPVYTSRPFGTSNTGQSLSMSSGTIDNPQHSVVLRMAQNISIGDNSKAMPEKGLILSTPVIVGKLELIKGIIYPTATNLLTVANAETSAVLQSKDSSYIIGPFRRSTAEAAPYLLPTGGAPVFSGGNANLTNITFKKDTAVIIPSAATPSVYQAEYFGVTHPDETHLTAPLEAIGKNKYWDISKISGATASIRLPLNSAVVGAAFDKALVVAHYENGSWVAVNGSALTPGNSSSGFVTSRVMSVFSPFTFGIISATDIPLAVHFSGFTARKTGSSATLDWSVEQAPAKFEILRSSNGTSYAKIGEQGASVSKKAYQFVDDKIMSGTNYYRIKSIEADGNSGLSVVNAVLNATDALAITYLAPNRVKQFASLFINTARAGKLDLMITDMSGKTWKRLSMDVTGGNTDKTIDFGNLPGGVYQITGRMNGLVTVGLRFVKE